MTDDKDPAELREEMVQTIVALTRMRGECSRLDLVKAGFGAEEIDTHFAMASALAALILKRGPKNH